MLAEARARGLKLTEQRIAIIREFACDTTHPTAQKLYERLRTRLPGMSFATVYNTLDALTEANLCAPMSLSRGVGRYDPNMSPHHHAVCDLCGAVSDVPLSMIEDDARTGARAIAEVSPGFEIRSVERIFRGLCASCAQRESR